MANRIGGISSGIDTRTLVQQLMEIERQPLSLMTKKQHMVELKKNMLSEVSSSLSTFKSKVDNLLKQMTFKPVKAVSSNEDIVTVKPGENAVPGVYELKNITTATYNTGSSVNSLEGVIGNETTAKVVSSQAVADINTKNTFATANFAGTISDGTVTINGVNFKIDADVTTVDQFLNQVNGDANAGVTISYDGSAFQIESKDEGSDARVILSDTSGFLSAAKIATGTHKGSGTADPTVKLNDAGISGLTADGNSLYFKINNYSFSFDTSVHSLNYVMEKINNSNAGVNMFYDGDTDKIYFSSKTAGPSTITFEDISGNFLNTTIGVTSKNGGANAQFDLNGVTMTKGSNQFEINGVTFNLKNNENAPVTVTIERNTDAMYTSIKEFVDSYNSTIKLLNTRLSEKTEKNALSDAMLSKGLLRGDSTISSVRSDLRHITTTKVDGLVNKYTTLMSIGITTSDSDFGKSGLLEIDETKLKEALKNDSESVKKLFFNDVDADDKIDDGEKGLAVLLSQKLESLISTSTTSINGRSYKAGIISMRLDVMNDEISSYDQRMESFEKRLGMIETRYWRQFTAMEKALSQLNNQSNWLSGQLASLSSM